MMTKLQRRLFKEGVIAAAAKTPEIAGYRKYWVDQPDNLELLSNGLTALQSCDELPWPAQPCIVGSQFHFMDRYIGNDLSRAILMLIRPSEDQLPSSWIGARASTGPPHEPVMYSVEFGHFMLYVKVRSDRNRIYAESDPEILFRCTFDSRDHMIRMFSHATPTKEFWEREAQIAPDRIPPDRVDEIWQLDQKITFASIPEHGRRCWLHACRPSDPNQKGYVIGTPNIELAALVAAAFPCGYRVRCKLRDGYGPPPVKEQTRGETVICMVNYDRLYGVAEESGCSGVVPDQEPQFRHGHYRHLWRQAGLDRNALPKLVSERMAVAIRHHVRRIYIHPYWTGKREFSHDGADWTIETGETEL